MIVQFKQILSRRPLNLWHIIICCKAWRLQKMNLSFYTVKHFSPWSQAPSWKKNHTPNNTFSVLKQIFVINTEKLIIKANKNYIASYAMSIKRQLFWLYKVLLNMPCQKQNINQHISHPKNPYSISKVLFHGTANFLFFYYYTILGADGIGI